MKGIVDVTMVGAKGDGVHDDAPAIQAAALSLKATGGVLVFPPGHYLCGSTLDLSELHSITLQGIGQAFLTYTPTTGPLVRMASASDITLRNLRLSAGSSYADHLMQTGWANPANPSDPGHLDFQDCILGGPAASLLNLDRAILVTVTRCQFVGGARGIIGRDRASTYSNCIQIRDSMFANQTLAAVHGPGEQWLVEGCTFEGGADGQAKGITSAPGFSWSLTVQNCWFGDASKPGGVWMDCQSMLGLLILGNRIAPVLGTNPAIRIAGCQGVALTGNRLESCLAFDGPSWGVCMTGNDFQGPPYVQGANGLVGYTSLQNNNWPNHISPAAA